MNAATARKTAEAFRASVSQGTFKEVKEDIRRASEIGKFQITLSFCESEPHLKTIVDYVCFGLAKLDYTTDVYRKNGRTYIQVDW